MDMKNCSKCKEQKTPPSFSKRTSSKDGLAPWCKTCQATYSHENKDRRIKYNKDYRQRLYVKKKAVERTKRKRADGDPGAIAQQKLRSAVVKGEIIKPSICSICEEKKTRVQIQGHHPNYDFPLAVVWCCCQCHNEVFHPRTSKHIAT